MRLTSSTSPPGPFQRSGRWLTHTAWSAAWLSVCAALAVHAQSHPTTPPVPMFLPADQPDNVFQAAAVLPVGLRRVAVLPLSWEGDHTELSQGGEILEPILLTTLIQTRKFEVITVNPEDLRHQTGRPNWSGMEILPADFLDSLQRVYACDAVLFCQLTTFHAYAPLAMGWRMKLVDVRTRQILWAVDETYDAEKPGVLHQARLFHAVGAWFARDPENDWLVENSPRQFGQYALTRSLLTLPNQKEMTKVSLPSADEPVRRQSNQKKPSTRKSYGN
jgi:hypothetical protein